MKQIKKGLFSEYQIQKNDSFCAAYCLYVLYLTQTLGFKNAVLNLYHQNLNLKIEKIKTYSAQFKIIQISCPPVQPDYPNTAKLDPHEIENNKDNKKNPKSFPK